MNATSLWAGLALTVYPRLGKRLRNMKLLCKTVTASAVAIAVVLGISTSAEAASLTIQPGTPHHFSTPHFFKHPVPPDLARKLQAALDKYVQETGNPGATVGIVSPQGTWFGASGVSNLTTQSAMLPDDIFGIGSTTKLFTAVTVVKLAEEGKLSLDDTLDKWLPEIAQKITDGKNITIRQLLNGKAGIYNYDGDEQFRAAYIADAQNQISTGAYKHWSPEEVIAYAYSKPRYEGSGCSSQAQWCYTNTSDILAGMIVEKATGSTFATVLRDQILNPLRLKHTFLSEAEPVSKEIPSGLAHGYQDVLKADGSFGQDGIPDDLTDLNFSAFWTNGAIFSNAQDLVRFSLALFGGRLLQPNSLKEMLTFVDVFDVSGASVAFKWGLGVESFESPWGRKLGRGGSHFGYDVQVDYLPDSGITAAFLVNRQYEIENPQKTSTLSGALEAAILNILLAEGQGGARTSSTRTK